jgi:hypothetical protein
MITLIIYSTPQNIDQRFFIVNPLWRTYFSTSLACNLPVRCLTIELTTTINAPIQRCFDIARDIDVHVASTAHTGERAIAGRTSGLIELGETVTWRAKHFGIWQNLTSKITDFNSPIFFADELVERRF